MRNRIVKIMITAMATVLLTGYDCIRTGEQDTEKYMTVNNITDSNTEIYFTRNQSDYDKVTEVLEKRNGKIIIEVIEATITDDEGNASDDLGFYIKYDSSKYKKGDRVQTVFVYNPETNYLDDILYRIDSLLK